jgi:Starch-binding associating with outer membrane
MKFKMKQKIYSIFAATALLLSSCTGDYLDINDNPNQAVSATPELVLSIALNNTAGRLAHSQVGNFFGGYWAPSGSYSGFIEERQFDYNASYATGVWSLTYDNLNDYQYIIEKAEAQKWKAMSGIAKVMTAYNYQILVDAYGNVPYSDALKGTASIRPKYDDAQAVYDGLIKTLDAASADLKVAISGDNPSPGVQDIVFKGDINKWRRFANSLRLRILMRQSNISGKDLKGEIAKVVAEGAGFLKAGETVNSTPGYLKTAGKMNPFWENYIQNAAGSDAGTKQAWVCSAFFINTIQDDLKDPRLARLAAKNNAGIYVGVPLGDGNDANLFPKRSWFGPAILKGFDQPMVLMTAAEAFFLQAEAVQRGYSTGDAKALYEAGVTEAFTAAGLTAADATKYLATSVNNVSWASSTDKIEAIITQKWVSMFSLTGFEAWCEVRRTGFPRVPLATKAVQAKAPARLFYPTSEIATNSENVAAQNVTSQFDNKIFWAKK